jgi:hypothetical protein
VVSKTRGDLPGDQPMHEAARPKCIEIPSQSLAVDWPVRPLTRHRSRQVVEGAYALRGDALVKSDDDTAARAARVVVAAPTCPHAAA